MGWDGQQCQCHHRHHGITPSPCAPPGQRPERRAPPPVLLPGLAALPAPIFIPGKVAFPPSVQTHLPCRKWLLEKLINQRMGLQMQLGEQDLPWPYLASPRTEGAVSWDSSHWVGSVNRSLSWVPTSHLTIPESLFLSSPQPQPSNHIAAPASLS